MFWLISLVIIFFVICLLNINSSSKRELDNQTIGGTKTIGKIVSFGVETNVIYYSCDMRLLPQYTHMPYFTYEFYTSVGVKHVKRQYVDDSFFAKAKIGDEVKVTYLEDNPEKSIAC